ncbi:protein translocase subunit SecD [Garciella nitratireducens]|uniref:Protein translocase subunit SecD n=1 Tax=Garciella nitratireducens DSM 15102 TaxID=1121911 RepID=A0A1T4K161_9FIRM|nr:protein translocase subunit SecD [Garciella nitratireducens]SJZ36190.1 preprotein translocase subunit SecD [Garciella nitratireducens DSM 15102]
MNLKKFIILIIIIAIIAFGVYTAINGLRLGNYQILPLKEGINLGLDLRGGVYVVLEAKGSKEDPITDEKMSRAIATIRQRVDGLGVSEATVTKQGQNRIRVSIPDIQDQDKALDMIGKTAQLEFIGPDKNVILTGEQVEDSQAVYQQTQTGEQPVVTLKFNKKGTAAFAKATKEFINQPISIVLDGEVISAPIVQSTITNGEAVITGQSTLEEASDLSTLIRAGALPVSLEPVEVRTVGPILGQDALSQSIKAAIIGVSLVFVFMILRYRLLGIVASLALVVYILLFFLVLVSIDSTLTLPGIAGLILSIGMAVDANIIIFERVKEELKLGKTLRSALDSGFSRALTSILDSNITTIIAGIVLFFFGSGSIKGFAVTLMIGIIVSMITAVLVTRYLLRLVVGTNLFTNIKLYGA